MFNDGFRNVIDDHAPIKERKIRSDQPPFLNKHLRQSIWSRKRLYKKFLTNRSDENWEAYKKLRNLCVDIRRKSIKSYFKNKFTDGKPSGATLLKTVKPFITNKGHQSGNDLILGENGNIVNGSKQVADIMNTYYINVAAHIGEPSANKNEYIDHPSIKSISEKLPPGSNFTFRHTTLKYVTKIIRSLNPKRATSPDLIPPKVVKIAGPEISKSITDMINKSIDGGIFPDCSKMAEVIPVYKKADSLKKENYRPVSILPCLSKIFERVMADQLNTYFKDIFDEALSAFRTGYSCQNTLLALTENFKKAVREHQSAGAILMDLSKAFDCMPHKLLIAKFKAYGLEDLSIQLVTSYLEGRKQRVRVGNERSEWSDIIKGVPQGSILGPIFFNIFYK